MLATVERARPTRVGDLVLAEPELLDELAVGVGRLERIEILALEVLDEGELELIAIGELADDRRDPLEAGRLGRTESALAGDELVAVDGLGDEDRLEDPVVDDALRSATRARRDRSACAADAGSAGSASIAISIVDGLARAALRDERGEPASEALGPLGSDGHDATIASCRSSRAVVGPSIRRASQLGRERGVGHARRSSPGSSARSAGRGSAPRTAGRCAGSPCRRRDRPRCRRTSAATSADRFVRPSYIVRTTPLMDELGVEVIANEIERGEQLGQSFQGVVLALQRDEHRIGGGQGVDGQQSERRRAVDEHVVVVGPLISDEQPRQPSLAALDGSELHLGAGERDRRRARRRDPRSGPGRSARRVLVPSMTAS